MAVAAAQVDALQHALAADAERVGNLLPVSHWALPTIDMAAADERYENVRAVANVLTHYMDDFDEEVEANASLPEQDSNRMFSNAEQQRSQRRLMFSVVDMLNEHAQRHEEAQRASGTNARPL